MFLKDQPLQMAMQRPSQKTMERVSPQNIMERVSPPNMMETLYNMQRLPFTPPVGPSQMLQADQQLEPYDLTTKKMNQSDASTSSYQEDSEDSCLGQSEHEQCCSPESYKFPFSRYAPKIVPQDEQISLTANSANKIFTPRPLRPTVIYSYPTEARSSPDYQNRNIQMANQFGSYPSMSTPTATLTPSPMTTPPYSTYIPMSTPMANLSSSNITSTSMPTPPYAYTPMMSTALSNCTTLPDFSPPSSIASTMVKINGENQNMQRPFKMIPKELLDTKSEAFIEFRNKKMMMFNKGGQTKPKKIIKRLGSPIDDTPCSSSSTEKGVKDELYWQRRRKNNEAAKRSRDARRAKEDAMALSLCTITKKYESLKMEFCRLGQEYNNLSHSHAILIAKQQ